MRMLIIICFLNFVVLFQQPSPLPPDLLIPSKPEKSNINWFEFPAQKKLSDDSWGNALTDIENHLPEKFGTYYRDSDKITWGHETTHGIHSHLNMTYRKSNEYGLYVGNNKAIMLPQPHVRISDIAEYVPNSMRKSRYQLYLVNQTESWNAEPIYLFDEWVAYVNGSEVGVELSLKGEKRNKSDYCLSNLEFTIYAFYVCIATQELDPKYDTTQLFAFTAWNAERAMKLYHQGYEFDHFNWDNHEYLKHLQNSPDAAKLRSWVIKTYGKKWAKDVLGFTE